MKHSKIYFLIFRWKGYFNTGYLIFILVFLGYNQSAAVKVVDAIVKENPTISVEKLIKEALNKLR